MPMKKIGILLTEANMDQFSEEDLAEWDAAIVPDSKATGLITQMRARIIWFGTAPRRLSCR